MILLRVAVAVLCLAIGCARAQDAPGWSLVNVGVLAHRGTGDFEARWAPLRAHLEREVPGWRFAFLPVTLTSARERLERGDLEFLITNPGHFVSLMPDFPMSVLATRVRRTAGGDWTDSFGSVILTRADSGITTLGDIAGRAVLAVDTEAFGGFQIAWGELDRHGIDLFAAPSSLAFVGFPQDEIVRRVLAGQTDVGIVRSGLLETMAAEGQISLDALRVINGNVDYTHPERVSTRLYPEWAFLAMAGTSATLRTAVARALLATSAPGAPRAAGLAEAWGAPVSYHAVRDLLAAYDAATARRRAAPFLWAALGVASLAMAWLALLVRRRLAADRHAGRGAAPGPGPAEAGPMAAPGPDLTRREQEILELISDGRSTKEIAKALGISPKTVEFHRSNLLRKFEVTSSLQLVKRAAGAGT